MHLQKLHSYGVDHLLTNDGYSTAANVPYHYHDASLVSTKSNFIHWTYLFGEGLKVRAGGGGDMVGCSQFYPGLGFQDAVHSCFCIVLHHTAAGNS